MKAKLGNLLMGLGLCLMLASAALLLYNDRQDRQASQASQAVMPELVEAIHTNIHREKASLEVAVAEAPVKEMTESEINGYPYIGFLAIPKLELELPVMSHGSYPELNIAPCRYSGNLHGDDLVIMAHNYQNHFGRIQELETGDSLSFTDMDGQTVQFTVAAKEVLPPTAVEEMTAGEFDLTLYTCTYGGENRMTIRCDRTME